MSECFAGYYEPITLLLHVSGCCFIRFFVAEEGCNVSSETSIQFPQITQCYIPEVNALQVTAGELGMLYVYVLLAVSGLLTYNRIKCELVTQRPA
jgi:hypothetical protein